MQLPDFKEKLKSNLLDLARFDRLQYKAAKLETVYTSYAIA